MSKKIVFMGTPEFSVQTLKTLSKSPYEIICVYTQPPKNSSRGQKINVSPIEKLSKKLGLKIKHPESLDNKNEFKYFKSLNPFIVVVVAYGKIIPKEYLNLPEKGFINIHASLLPKWRGAAPIHRSIMNKDSESGISFMKIEESLDKGPYCKQIKVPIDSDTTTKSLSETFSKLGAENIVDCLKSIEMNTAKFLRQDESKATYAFKIEKKEARINWSDTRIDIISKINALNPYPVAWFEYEGTRYKIWKATISDLKGKPGEVLDESLIIGCQEKSIQILEIQKEGKKRMSVDDFLSGSKIPIGTIIS